MYLSVLNLQGSWQTRLKRILYSDVRATKHKHLNDWKESEGLNWIDYGIYSRIHGCLFNAFGILPLKVYNNEFNSIYD